MKRNCFLCICVGLIWSIAANGQPYSLQQCIGFALSDNLELAAGRTDLAMSGETLREAQSALLPQVSIAGEYKYFFDVPTQLIPGALFGGPADSYAGAQLGVPANQSANLNASQILYHGQALMALRVAQTGRKASGIQIAKTTESIVYNVSASYYNLQALSEQRRLLNARLEALDTLLQKTRLLAANGLAKSIEVNRLLVNKKNLETKLAELADAAEKLKSLLRLLCNIPQHEPFEIIETLDLTMPEGVSAPDTSVYVQRIEYQLLQTQEELLSLTQKMIRRGYQPVLSAFGQVGLNGFNSRFEGLNTYQGRYYPVSLVGLSLHIPVFDGFRRRSQLQTKGLELVKNRQQQALFRQQAQMEASNAVRACQVARQNLDMQVQNKDLASQNYAQTSLSYRQGMASLAEVLNAENDLKEAQTYYLNAFIQLKIAVLDFEKATGALIRQ